MQLFLTTYQAAIEHPNVSPVGAAALQQGVAASWGQVQRPACMQDTRVLNEGVTASALEQLADGVSTVHTISALPGYNTVRGQHVTWGVNM